MHQLTAVTSRRGFLAAAAGTLAAAGGTLLAFGAHQRPPAPAPLPASTFSLTAPPRRTIAAPSATARSTGRPTPTTPSISRVSLPRLGIDAGWEPVPFTAGSLTIPTSVRTVGLSSAGAQPGATTGTILLASHVDYVGQGRGVFYRLYQVEPGDLIVLSDPAGRSTRWLVTGLADPLKADLDPGLFTTTGPLRLVLVTCGGAVHHGEYDRNVVVTARPETGQR